ncbi:MAG: hypothetical protein WCY42_03595 [Candidatus Omnitrophota bacterium]
MKLTGIFSTAVRIKEVKIKMQAMSSIRRDFLVSRLRSQLNRLRNVLKVIEDEEQVDSIYADESLRQIEVTLRNIRKSSLYEN